MFSIIIPSFNNFQYLKLCVNSIKKNSQFDHQIILHINEGSDGSLDYVKENNIEHTYSKKYWFMFSSKFSSKKSDY